MADTDVKQEEQAQKKGRKKPLVMGGVFLGVMILEAVLVFVLVKSFSQGPQDAEASGPGGLDAEAGQAAVERVEVEVVRFRAQNDQSRRMLVYDLSVFATVPEDQKEDLEKLIEAKKNTIQDRFSGVIRAADPQRFLEPDLATLRQQFEKVLSEIVGDDVTVDEVLIPSIVSYSDG